MSELPFPDLRSKIIPDTLLYVKIFRHVPNTCANAESANDIVQARSLEDQITDWVNATGNIIVLPGAVTYDNITQTLAVTYVKAVSDNHDRQAQAQQSGIRAAKTVQVPAVLESNSSGAAGPAISTAWLSDGGGRSRGS